MRSSLLAVVLSALTLATSAQSRLPPGVDSGTGGAMATRSVTHYLELERALAEALQERRPEAVMPMLAPDFETRSAQALDAVAGVEGLVAHVLPGRAAPRVRDLAVRELGDVAVVSFLLDRPAPSPHSTLYVIDVWQQQAGKLAARYVSEPARPLPAPTRPRGRE
jgi:hypothetical protein